MSQLFRFPDPVNETSARVVAGGVVLQAVTFLITGEGWLLVPLVYGFVARVATGPTLSPLGQFAIRVVTPRLHTVEHRFVPGPPKRFAQAIGAACTSVVAVAWLVGAPAVSYAALVLLTIAATLESVFAVCLGCIAYRCFRECEDCNDISERLGAATASGVPATK